MCYYHCHYYAYYYDYYYDFYYDCVIIIITIMNIILVIFIMTVNIAIATVMCYRNHRPCLGPLYSALHVYLGTQIGTIIFTKLPCGGYKATSRILTARRLFEKFLIYDRCENRRGMSLNHVLKASAESANGKFATTLQCSFSGGQVNK